MPQITDINSFMTRLEIEDKIVNALDTEYVEPEVKERLIDIVIYFMAKSKVETLKKIGYIINS